MADPKNKWDQPAAPPPPMFFGKKERDLVKQVNDELSERIIGQPIAYYPISIDESNFNETYGEAIEKVSLPPIRIYAYVEVDNEQANETFGYDYQTKLTVNFSQRRITEDQNVYVRVGDFVQYGDFFYEIVRTYNDTRYYFGQVEHKFQISAECVRARDGAFRVMPAVDRPTESKLASSGEASSPAPRPAPYPPLAASYVTVNPEAKLPNERVLAAGSGITLTDTGAGGTLTIASTGGGAGDGIFTTINGTQAYVTSSLAIGGTSAPDHKISVSGSVSASVNISASAFYGDGSNLSGITTSPAGLTTQLQYNAAGAFAGSSNLTFNGTTLTGSYTGSLGELTTLSSSFLNLQPTSGSMAGPGSYLSLDTNNNVVLATGDGASTSPAAPVNSIQFNNASAFGGSSNLTYDTSTNFMVLSGTMALSSSDDNVAFRIDNAQSTTLGPALFVTGSRGSDSAARQSVGIGTDDPQYALDVRGYLSVGSMGGAYIFVHNDSDTFIRFGQAGSDSMQFKAGNVNFLEFDENGRDWAVFNSASADVDFQVRTLNNTASLFVEGSTDRVGIGTSVPSHELTVAGALSASGNSFFAGDVTIEGTLIGGSPLDVSGSINIVNSVGTVVASLGATTSASVAQVTTLSASAFHLNAASGTLAGAGSYLGLDSNNNLVLTVGDGASSGGLVKAINASSAYLTSSLALGGTTAADHALSISGSVSASVNVSASAFYGDGADLTSLTIGAAEDASYADGLFTDFATTTPVGTAVDRFNEILKALSPGPAPNLDDIDCNDTGVSAELSFGASQGISGYTNVGTAAGFSAVDINGTYGTSTSSNNLRRGTFNGSRVIDGDLNEDVSADGVNYPANSFGDADKGDLVLEVNGTTLHTASMTDPDVGTGVPGSGTGTDLNGNGSGFYSLSQTGSAEFDDSTELDLFQHRTGKYKVVAADQREGWNYLRVVHTSSAFDRTTNYVAWVNDSNSNPLTPSGEALDTLAMTGDLRLSGVKYHTGGTAEYRVAVSNAYRNVYTATNISYTVTNGSIPSVSMPTISVGSEDETKVLHLTGSLTVDGTSILNSSIAAGVDVSHPLKSNLSDGGNQSISGILAYNRSNNSTTTSETFRRENYRLDSGSLSSYAAQADVTDAANTWDSTTSLTTVDGLLFYNQRLYSPIDGDIPNSGDFSTITNGPAANVDYSSLSGTRTFFRYFTQTGAASQTNFELSFTGDNSTRIVPASTGRSATNIHVFVKLPTTSTGKSTGWLDLGAATANDPAQLDNLDGAYVGTPPAGGLEINNDTHEATFVTQTVEQNENIVIKIVAEASWTGYISALSISWGGG